MRVSASRPSPALIVSVVSLIVALGGTSYAALKLPANSVTATQIKSNAVGSSEIKAGAVGSSEIKAGAVTSSDVKDGSLLKTDFQAGQLPAGATGPAGPAGPAGAAGAAGPAGVVGSTVVRRIDHTLADGQSTASDVGNVQCEAGEKPISGGANFVPVNHGDARISGSGPRKGTLAAPVVPASGEAWTIWRGTAFNPAGGDAADITVRVYIICATP